MANTAGAGFRGSVENIGRGSLSLIDEFGYYLALVVECLYWIFVGPFKRQPVKIAATFEQMVEIGMAALPIVFILSFSIGVMLGFLRAKKSD